MNYAYEVKLKDQRTLRTYRLDIQAESARQAGLRGVAQLRKLLGIELVEIVATTQRKPAQKG